MVLDVGRILGNSAITLNGLSFHHGKSHILHTRSITKLSTTTVKDIEYSRCG